MRKATPLSWNLVIPSHYKILEGSKADCSIGIYIPRICMSALREKAQAQGSRKHNTIGACDVCGPE
jgi:hypothetical protein